jgi:hypothetical protein
LIDLIGLMDSPFAHVSCFDFANTPTHITHYAIIAPSHPNPHNHHSVIHLHPVASITEFSPPSTRSYPHLLPTLHISSLSHPNPIHSTPAIHSHPNPTPFPITSSPTPFHLHPKAVHQTRQCHPHGILTAGKPFSYPPFLFS